MMTVECNPQIQHIDFVFGSYNITVAPKYGGAYVILRHELSKPSASTVALNVLGLESDVFILVSGHWRLAPFIPLLHVNQPDVLGRTRGACYPLLPPSLRRTWRPGDITN